MLEAVGSCVRGNLAVIVKDSTKKAGFGTKINEQVIH